MSQILSESKRLRERKKENENVKRILLTAKYLLPSSKTHASRFHHMQIEQVHLLSFFIII